MKYWAIRVTTALNQTGVVYLQAAMLSVGPTGALYAWDTKDKGRELQLVVASGSWSAFYAISADDPRLRAVLAEQPRGTPMSFFENLKYNFDVDDWAVAECAKLRARGKDPKIAISRDMDGEWCIVGIKLDGKMILAPREVTARWMKRVLPGFPVTVPVTGTDPDGNPIKGEVQITPDPSVEDAVHVHRHTRLYLWTLHARHR